MPQTTNSRRIQVVARPRVEMRGRRRPKEVKPTGLPTFILIVAAVFIAGLIATNLMLESPVAHFFRDVQDVIVSTAK